jgi:STE24 endopeptidase
LTLLVTGGFGWLDSWLREYYSNPMVIGLAFFGILFIVSDVLGLPFQLYGTFVIEQKFGFNKMTVRTFIFDKLKSYLLTIVIGGGLSLLFFWLVNLLGQSFWLYFWAIAAVLILIINMFYTSLILPLFNKLTPLEDGALKQAIQEYAKKVSFPLDNIFVIDGSKRSSKANAFFSGLGKKKKIVLYDTLINNHSTEELVAVLAHEVGHFKKKHIVQSLIISVLQTGLILFVLSQFVFSSQLSLALGGTVPAIHLNLLAFGILFSPISHILGLAMNVLSRKNEFEADHFAKTTYEGKPLVEALKKLSVNNLSNLLPHPWYVFFHYSHPPLLQRLEALER